jgi:hypothetical protein
MEVNDLAPFIGPNALETLRRAERHVAELAARSAKYFESELPALSIDPSRVCMAVTGSMGRSEALGASDFDLLPVTADDATLELLLQHNEPLRAGLEKMLGVDVSRGRDLLKSVSLTHLMDPECIGGDKDDRAGLTQRVLLLTESRQVGGSLALGEVRRQILEAYAHHRSAGRHAMAYCNDLARYYRTVCIDYKSRVDTRDKDWCNRNVKLRHSRKLWFFANLLSVSAVSCRIRPDNPHFFETLLRTLDQPPILRMFEALESNAQLAGGRVLDQYAWFLDFMANGETRKKLAAIEHDARYRTGVDNPFPSLQWSSRVLHSEMITVLESVNPELRRKVLDWFLL